MRLALPLALGVLLAAPGCRRSEPAPAPKSPAPPVASDPRPAPPPPQFDGSTYAGVAETDAGPTQIQLALTDDGVAALIRTLGGPTPQRQTARGTWKDEGGGLVSVAFPQTGEAPMLRRAADTLVAVAFDPETYGRGGFRLLRAWSSGPTAAPSARPTP